MGASPLLRQHLLGRAVCPAQDVQAVLRTGLLAATGVVDVADGRCRAAEAIHGRDGALDAQVRCHALVAHQGPLRLRVSGQYEAVTAVHHLDAAHLAGECEARPVGGGHGKLPCAQVIEILLAVHRHGLPAVVGVVLVHIHRLHHSHPVVHLVVDGILEGVGIHQRLRHVGPHLLLLSCSLADVDEWPPTTIKGVSLPCTRGNVQNAMVTCHITENFIGLVVFLPFVIIIIIAIRVKDRWRCALNIYIPQFAIVKRIIVDTGHTLGYGDRGQTRAATECICTDTCHAIGYDNGGQARAAIESQFANYGQIVGKGD